MVSAKMAISKDIDVKITDTFGPTDEEFTFVLLG